MKLSKIRMLQIFLKKESLILFALFTGGLLHQIRSCKGRVGKRMQRRGCKWFINVIIFLD